MHRKIKNIAPLFSIFLVTFLPGFYLIHSLYTPNSIKNTHWTGSGEMYINNGRDKNALVNIVNSDIIIKIKTEINFISDNSFNATVAYTVKNLSPKAPSLDINFVTSGTWKEFENTIKFSLIDITALEPSKPSAVYLLEKNMLRRFLIQQFTHQNYTKYELSSNRLILENVNHQLYILNKIE